MEVKFESDYQSRVLQVSFPEGSVIASARDITAWRTQWLKALATWHSPYKALIDFSNVEFTGDRAELAPEIEKMFLFLKGFFLQRSVGCGIKNQAAKKLFPFEIYASYQEAQKAAGVRQGRVASGGDLRQQLHFDNHFPQRVIELTVTEPVVLDSSEKLQVLKSKLINVLMQWHSPWTLLIDCSRLAIPPAQHAAFGEMLHFFKGFFLEEVLGYGSREPKEAFPFPVYRARHIASAKVKSSIPQAGDTANCATRKTKK
jgi:hypothetical protein